MKILFISNYFNHHQIEISNALCNVENTDYTFLETTKMKIEREKMGYSINNFPSYVNQNIGNNAISFAEKYIYNSDIIIFGGASDDYLKLCNKSGKLMFIYTERIYKNGCQLYKLPLRIYKFWKKYSMYKNKYLLCASAYTYADYAKSLSFVNKAYKWGYFPKTMKYEIDELLSKKDKKRILWCGRFLDWKHPDDVIKLAKNLKLEGYNFEINIIGLGDLENSLKELVDKFDLKKEVEFLGALKPEEVRKHMERAGIYLFTSDFHEGWGAVLNESMNSGCAVVASHAIGSVPYLINHEENGLIYKYGNFHDLYKKVKWLLNKPDEQERLGRNAYYTIANLWNAEIAVERFLKLTKEIKDHGYCDLYDEGPCSRANILSNDWFKG